MGNIKEQYSPVVSSYQTPSGYLLYPVRKDNVHLRNPGTVTIKHNIAVVSPALTFANVLNVNPDFYIALAVRNGQKQLFSLGKNYLALQATSGSPFRISTRHCSQIRDLCVTTNKPDGGVMSLSWMLIFLLSLFGIITGCWMVSLIDSALEAKNSLEKRFIRAVKKKIFILSTSRSFRPATELWWRMKPWSDGRTGILAGYLRSCLLAWPAG